jgi:hypothetical protein
MVKVPKVGPDPRFPDRPMHDDFSLLSAVIIAMDAEAEAAPPDGEIIPKMLAPYIDPDSLTYMAMQRSVRALGLTSGAQIAAMTDELITVTGLYLDAFTAGCKYQQAKGAVDG